MIYSGKKNSLVLILLDIIWSLVTSPFFLNVFDQYNKELFQWPIILSKWPISKNTKHNFMWPFLSRIYHYFSKVKYFVFSHEMTTLYNRHDRILPFKKRCLSEKLKDLEIYIFYFRKLLKNWGPFYSSALAQINIWHKKCLLLKQY